MPYFTYPNIKPYDFSNFLSGPVSEFLAQRQIARNEQMREEEMRRKQDLERLQEQRLQQQHEATMNEERLKQQQLQAKGAGSVLSLLGSGQEPQARAQAAAYGMPLSVVPRGPGPTGGTPPAPLPPVSEGPLQNPAMARSYAAQRFAGFQHPGDQTPEEIDAAIRAQEAGKEAEWAAKMDVARMENERALYAEAAQARPAQVAAYEEAQATLPQRQADYENQKRYQLVVGGKPVEASLEQLRYNQRQLDSNDFLQAVTPELRTDADRQAARVAYGQILAGAPLKTAVDNFNKLRLADVTGTSGFANKTALQTQRDAAALERTKLMAEAGKSRTYIMAGTQKEKLAQGERRLEQADRREVERETMNLFNQHEYKKSFSVSRDLLNSAEDIAKGNSALDIQVSASFAKKANGAGVLTDKDFDRFWSAIGGIGPRSADFASRVLNGTLGDEKRAIVNEAIAHKVVQAKQDLQDILDAGDAMFGDNKYWQAKRKGYFGSAPTNPIAGQARALGARSSGISDEALIQMLNEAP